jgi:putative nucleotidyltransferase with HDIG domain
LPFVERGDYREWGQAVEVHDPGTGGHTIRVSRLFSDFARSLGVGGISLELARKGAMVHDIGKLAVPGAILNKPGPLDDDEWDLIRQHPLIGVNMLGPVTDEPDILNIVRHHHERWDGTGYPDRLAGEDIPFLARIFSVVDVFDALCSKRPYKDKMTEREALGIIRAEGGKQFDPEIVDAFMKLYDFLKQEGEDMHAG